MCFSASMPTGYFFFLLKINRFTMICHEVIFLNWLFQACLGGGNDDLLQYSCLENRIDREAWQATVHGLAKSWTWLSTVQACGMFFVFFFNLQNYFLKAIIHLNCYKILAIFPYCAVYSCSFFILKKSVLFLAVLGLHCFEGFL